jgi:DNA invertase Pin-like site-specific DNA recombinase
MNTTGQAKYIAYFRVSTARQGKSGLGLDAQRQAVLTHLNGAKLISEFTEVESGRRSDRPKLTEALAACRVHKATLVIAKLDRLARNVAFVSNLMEAGVDFQAVDFPTANRAYDPYFERCSRT